VSDYAALLGRLTSAGVRYVVVGGIAVVLQGYTRATMDLDLAIDLDTQNVLRTIDVLTASGLVSRLPVDPKGFADAAIRQEWVEQKNLLVFTLHHPTNPVITVDLFAVEHIPFPDLWQHADIIDVAGSPVRVASIPDLITMKRLANRLQDVADIAKLEQLEKERSK
jgi:hypothetical protein